jgi:hypothetical protein
MALHEDLKTTGILLVQTDDQSFIERTRLTTLPALGFYRNGELMHFDGHIESETAVMKFLTDLDNILLDNRIESVSLAMLRHIAKNQDDGGSLFVFLYDEDDGRAQVIEKNIFSSSLCSHNYIEILFRNSIFSLLKAKIMLQFLLGMLPFWRSFLLAPIFNDQSCSFLANHNSCSINISSNNPGHDGSVDDSQTINPMNS